MQGEYCEAFVQTMVLRGALMRVVNQRKLRLSATDSQGFEDQVEPC